MGCGPGRRTSHDADPPAFPLPVVLEEDDEAAAVSVASSGGKVRMMTKAAAAGRRRHFSEGSGRSSAGCGRNYYLVDDIGEAYHRRGSLIVDRKPPMNILRDYRYGKLPNF